MTVHYRGHGVTLHHGDCIDVLRAMPDASVDSVCTDPPYGLEFMGKDWDRPWAVTPTAGVGFEGREDNLTLPSHRDGRNANCRACGGRQRGAKRCACAAPKWDRDPAADMREFGRWCEAWAAECLRVLKPGGHLLAFGGTRTWHRLAVAVEDAGFEVRDSIAWLYGSGFPKSLDVSKAIDKAAGAERQVVGIRPQSGAKFKETQRQIDNGGFNDPTRTEFNVTAPATDAAREWAGWGTALKPAFEPVVVARKPLVGTVAGNVLTHGTGALNIDATRIDGAKGWPDSKQYASGIAWGDNKGDAFTQDNSQNPSKGLGRWPANVILDEDMAGVLDQQSGNQRARGNVTPTVGGGGMYGHGTTTVDHGAGDTGGASRFFAVMPSDKAAGARRLHHRSCILYDLDPNLTSGLHQSRDCRCPKVEAHPCGHIERLTGCGGCDPGAIDLVVTDDGVRRPFEPARDLREPARPAPLDDLEARFKYVAKAPKRERPVVDGVAHPTVKPLALMRWLVRLVTPPGGTVLEPFAGSGTTVEACLAEGFQCIAIEKGDEYLPLIRERIRRATELPEAAELNRTTDQARAIAEQVAGQLDIFGEETA